MRIIHFSDTHEACAPESWRAFFDKRLLGFLNSRLFRKHLHRQEVLERATAKILELAPDLIVCTGDLTSSGQPGEFQRSLARLKPLYESKIPMLYLPGNHDAYVRDRACRKALEEAFETVNQGRFKLDALPQALDMACCRILAINCAWPTLPFLSCGFMDAANSEFVVAECAKPKKGFRIVAGHFPLLERHPWKRIRHKLYGHDAVAKLLKSKDIDVSLCGHVHRPYECLDAEGRGEICAGSLTRYFQFSLIELEQTSGRIRQERVKV